MLRELSVNNFALLKELKVELGERLNILTGATGAGKSILVDAIGLLLGGRAGRHMIRRGASSATVEGAFDLSSRKTLLDKLEDLGLTLDGSLLILKRQISGKGDSRAYANGSRLTMTQLKKVGDLLIDLHGQHDHQSLLHSEQHLDLLDEYGGLQDLRDRVADEHRELVDLHRDLQDLTKTIHERRERQELFQFQLREIEQVRPEEGEDEALERERRILENVESLFEGINSAYLSLFEEDNSIVQRLSTVRQTLERLGQTDVSLQKSEQECASLVYQLEDLSAGLRQYVQGLRRDPERLAVVQERLGDLQRLRRKYGGSLSAVLRCKRELAEKLSALAGGDERQEWLREKLATAAEGFGKRCNLLSSARKEAALKLQREVERELARLGMPKTRFAIQIEQLEDEAGWIQVSGRRFSADATGMDRVEFLIAPNPGEGLRPLAKIASGGEISRIMLALKTILAQADQVPLLVFDEIDVGIGGEVAEAVGLALKSLVRSHQVLCITHLHQIASLADEHLFVHKKQRRGRTETVIKRLSAPERVKEIARMMAGEEITQITLDHAQEMIQKGEQPEASLG